MAGGSFSVGIAYVAKWFDKENQGLAMGIFGAGNAGLLLAGLSATDSTSVFQASQAGHLPSQRGLVPPQSLQMKRVFSLAMWAAI